MSGLPPKINSHVFPWTNSGRTISDSTQKTSRRLHPLDLQKLTPGHWVPQDPKTWMPWWFTWLDKTLHSTWFMMIYVHVFNSINKRSPPSGFLLPWPNSKSWGVLYLLHPPTNHLVIKLDGKSAIFTHLLTSFVGNCPILPGLRQFHHGDVDTGSNQLRGRCCQRTPWGEKSLRTIGVCLKIRYIPNYSHLIGIMIINHWV